MSRPRGIGVFRRILYNILSNKSPRTTQMRDEIFGPVRSKLDAKKLLPGSQSMAPSASSKLITGNQPGPAPTGNQPGPAPTGNQPGPAPTGNQPGPAQTGNQPGPAPTGGDPVEVGRDYLGNVYWEQPPDPVKGRTKFKRWYFPQSDDDWDRPIPPEWESWLRYRRPDSPSEEEINRNIAIAQLKKIRAKEIEEKRTSDPLRAGLESNTGVDGEAKEEKALGEEERPSKEFLGSSIEDQEPKTSSDVMTGMYPLRKDLESTPGSSTRARKTDPMYEKID